MVKCSGDPDLSLLSLCYDILSIEVVGCGFHKLLSVCSFPEKRGRSPGLNLGAVFFPVLITGGKFDIIVASPGADRYKFTLFRFRVEPL